LVILIHVHFSFSMRHSKCRSAMSEGWRGSFVQVQLWDRTFVQRYYCHGHLVFCFSSLCLFMFKFPSQKCLIISYIISYRIVSSCCCTNRYTICAASSWNNTTVMLMTVQSCWYRCTVWHWICAFWFFRWCDVLYNVYFLMCFPTVCMQFVCSVGTERKAVRLKVLAFILCAEKRNKTEQDLRRTLVNGRTHLVITSSLHTAQSLRS